VSLEGGYYSRIISKNYAPTDSPRVKLRVLLVKVAAPETESGLLPARFLIATLIGSRKALASRA